MEPYSTAQLSDGERNALPIAADVLTAPAGTLLLIDEPERHLHRSISSPLLMLLFARRPDCGFVISTHDIELALDHRRAATVLVRGCKFEDGVAVRWDADLLAPEADIGEDLKRAVLGARRKLIFVEGTGASLDKSLYNILFPEASVVAAQSCRNVEQAVAGLTGAAGVNWVRP
jgi:energy-coupling factor transporter ATP-binding protein EcfA2